MDEDNLSSKKYSPEFIENVDSVRNKLIELTTLNDELRAEKRKWIDLNQKMNEEIGKLSRNGNFGFYFFLSTALFCACYLISK